MNPFFFIIANRKAPRTNPLEKPSPSVPEPATQDDKPRTRAKREKA